MTAKASIGISFLLYFVLVLSIMAQKAGIDNLFINFYVATCFFLGLSLLGFPIFAILVIFYDKLILPRSKFAQILEMTERKYSKKEYKRAIYATFIFATLVMGLILLIPIIIFDLHERIIYPICFLSGMYVYGFLSGFFIEALGYQYEERIKVLEEIMKRKKIIVTKKDFYRIGSAFILIGVIFGIVWNIILHHEALAGVLVPILIGISVILKGLKSKN